MPSTRRMWGSFISQANDSAESRFAGIVASDEPPRTVKSSPDSTTGRSSMRASPKMKLDGVRWVSRRSSSYSATPAVLPISWNDPLSATASMRSRTVILPKKCCRSTLSGPPSASANASRRRSSAISGSQLMATSSTLGIVERPANDGPGEGRSWAEPRSRPPRIGHVRCHFHVYSRLFMLFQFFC